MKVKNLNDKKVVIRKGSFSFSIDPGIREVTKEELNFLSPYICLVKNLQLIDDEGKVLNNGTKQREKVTIRDVEETNQEVKEGESEIRTLFTYEELDTMSASDIKELALARGATKPLTRAKALEYLERSGHIKDDL